MSNNPVDSLYKFCSSETAKAILGTRTLRWSAPERFGDPFEIHSDPDLNFSTDGLLEATIKLTTSMIFAPEQPKGDSPLINAVRRWRDEARFASFEEAHPVLKELLSKMVDNRLSQLELGLSKWASYARNVRVCCFSGKPDNLVAWEQFADNHQGVAIRFAVAEAGALSNPKPVTYQTERPELTVLREQLGCIMQNRKDSLVERFEEHYLIKSKHRRLEDEYRLIGKSKIEVNVSNNSPDTWFDDIQFTASDVTSVCFGLRTPSADKKDIIALLKDQYAKVKVFQAVKAKQGYVVELEKA